MKQILLVIFSCLSIMATPQTREVSGRVSSAEDGTSLPGVNVIVKGTTNGTVTDSDGKYKLNIPAEGGVLIFSFIGFEAKEVALGDQSVINVALASDVKYLSEVVVVGYGTQNRKELTGSVATVSGKEIAAMPIQSFDQALQGRASGVNVTTPNGVLNNPPVIRIRGVNSIALSSFPLVVIDGIPTFSGDQSGNSAANNPLASVNPADIESIEILKDASASAIYGSRASAGVILITTKKGKEGRSLVTLDSWVGVTQPFNLVKLLNAEQYLQIKNEAAANAGRGVLFFRNQDANGRDIDTDWNDYVYRTGVAVSNSLSVSGGTANTSYYFSVGHTDQEGMIRANSFERTNARLNLDAKVNDWIRIGTNLNFTNALNRAPNTGSLPGQAFTTSGLARLAFVTAPIVGPYLNDGTYNIASNNQIGRLTNLDAVGFTNPEFLIRNNRFSSETNQFQGSLYVSWEPVKGLQLKTTYGVDRLMVEDITFLSPLHGDGFGSGGSATNALRNIQRWNWQNTAQYDFQLSEKHSFSLLAGGEQQYTDIVGWGLNRTVLADDFYRDIQGSFVTNNPAGLAQGENYLLSYFSRVNYDFGKKYFLTLNLRRDGYSAFAAGNKYGTFYGAAVAYAISEEAFYKKTKIADVVDFLKVRATYGSVGNTQGIGNFASLDLYGSLLHASTPTLVYAQAPNPDLKWETSTKTDIGVSFGILQDRIQGEVVYYNNQIDDMILAVPLAPSKGVPGNSIDQNIGSMENTGIELTLSAKVINKEKFSWTTSFNLTTQKNEVTKLAGGDILSATSLETANISRVGESIGSLYVVRTAGVNPENGRRIFVKRDGSLVQYNPSGPIASRYTLVSDGSVTTAPTTAADGVVYGPTLPTFYGGFDNTFRYGSFDLGIFLQYSGGNYIYNGTRAGLLDQRFWNNSTEILNRWTPENPNGKLPRVFYLDNISNGSAFPISENVEKGDFMRVRNIVLGYSFKNSLLSRIHVKNLRVYAQVQNAFLFSNYRGFDPEVSTNGNSTTAIGVDRNSVGQARTFTFGLNLSL